jgi:hypothetical protein
MKIGLDLDKKEITLEKNVDLQVFFKTIKKILPDGEWKKFKLNTNTTITYNYPVYYTYPLNYDWCKFDYSDTVTIGDGVGTTNTGDNVVTLDNNTTSSINVGNQFIVEIP